MQGNQLSFVFTLLNSTLSSLQTAMCYVAAGGPKEYAIIFSSAEHKVPCCPSGGECMGIVSFGGAVYRAGLQHKIFAIGYNALQCWEL